MPVRNTTLGLTTMPALAAALLLMIPASVSAQPDYVIRGAAERAERELTTREILSETKLTLDERNIQFDHLIQLLGDRTDIFFDLHEDEGPGGFDATVPVTIRVKEGSAKDVLRFAVMQASRRMGQEVGWQEGMFGSIEVGFKSKLNESARIEVYPISDLVFEIPNYVRNVPTLDQVYRNPVDITDGRTGGPRKPGVFSLQETIEDEREIMTTLKRRGLRDPVREELAAQDVDGQGHTHRQILAPTMDKFEAARRARADNITRLITTSIEPAQWQHPALNIQYNDEAKMLIVTAPEYIHRQIGDGLRVRD